MKLILLSLLVAAAVAAQPLSEDTHGQHEKMARVSFMDMLKLIEMLKKYGFTIDTAIKLAELYEKYSKAKDLLQNDWPKFKDQILAELNNFSGYVKEVLLKFLQELGLDVNTPEQPENKAARASFMDMLKLMEMLKKYGFTIDTAIKLAELYEKYSKAKDLLQNDWPKFKDQILAELNNFSGYVKEVLLKFLQELGLDVNTPEQPENKAVRASFMDMLKLMEMLKKYGFTIDTAIKLAELYEKYSKAKDLLQNDWPKFKDQILSELNNFSGYVKEVLLKFLQELGLDVNTPEQPENKETRALDFMPDTDVLELVNTIKDTGGTGIKVMIKIFKILNKIREKKNQIEKQWNSYKDFINKAMEGVDQKTKQVLSKFLGIVGLDLGWDEKMTQQDVLYFRRSAIFMH